jgi:hypothetical protein
MESIYNNEAGDPGFDRPWRDVECDAIEQAGRHRPGNRSDRAYAPKETLFSQERYI